MHRPGLRRVGAEESEALILSATNRWKHVIIITSLDKLHLILFEEM